MLSQNIIRRALTVLIFLALVSFTNPVTVVKAQREDFPPITYESEPDPAFVAFIDPQPSLGIQSESNPYVYTIGQWPALPNQKLDPAFVTFPSLSPINNFFTSPSVIPVVNEWSALPQQFSDPAFVALSPWSSIDRGVQNPSAIELSWETRLAKDVFIQMLGSAAPNQEIELTIRTFGALIDPLSKNPNDPLGFVIAGYKYGLDKSFTFMIVENAYFKPSIVVDPLFEQSLRAMGGGPGFTWDDGRNYGIALWEFTGYNLGRYWSGGSEVGGIVGQRVFEQVATIWGDAFYSATILDATYTQLQQAYIEAQRQSQVVEALRSRPEPIYINDPSLSYLFQQIEWIHSQGTNIASSTSSFGSNPNGGFQSFPDSSWQSNPNGGFQSFPDNGWQSNPNGGFQSFPDSGWQSIPNGGFQYDPSNDIQPLPSMNFPP